MDSQAHHQSTRPSQHPFQSPEQFLTHLDQLGNLGFLLAPVREDLLHWIHSLPQTRLVRRTIHRLCARSMAALAI